MNGATYGKFDSEVLVEMLLDGVYKRDDFVRVKRVVTGRVNAAQSTTITYT